MHELISIEHANLLPEKLFEEDGTEDILKQIEAEALSLVPDATTPAGRKEIASMAYEVARSKTYLDGLGKDLVSGIKKQAIVIDAERRKVRERLDELKVRVRKPLTDFEEVDKRRIAALKERVATIHVELPEGTQALRARLAELKAIEIDETWQEFAGNAALAKEQAIAECDAALKQSVKRDEEEAAAAAAEKKAREEREEMIRAKARAEEKARAEAAAEKARQDAENARIAAERAKQEEIERIKREAEAEKLAAEKAAEQERQRLIAEQEAKLAAEKRAAEEAVRAEQERARKEAARIDEERAREAEAARLAEEERKRKEREAKEEQERKAANLNHRRAVNRMALADLVAHANVTEAQGKAIIKAIASGEIAHVSLRY